MATTARSGSWSDSYKVDVRSMDDDHFILFSLVTELQEAKIAGSSKESLSCVLDHLVSYIQYHFSSEEQTMRESGYPGFAGHKASHDRFARDVREFSDEFRQDRADISEKMLRYLGNWIAQHIMESDKKLAAYLAEHSAE